MTLDAVQPVEEINRLAMRIGDGIKESGADAVVVAVAKHNAVSIAAIGSVLEVEGVCLYAERRQWQKLEGDLPDHPYAKPYVHAALEAGASAVIVAFSRSISERPLVASAGRASLVLGLVGRIAAHRQGLWLEGETVSVARGNDP